MTRELFPRETMNVAQARTEYVGALLTEEQRLMLVPVKPDDPWAAFRQLRRVMRKRKANATVALFESDMPIEHQADVIPLASRRRAG